MRGEYAIQRSRQKKIVGSPPLARGVHIKSILRNLQSGITPACAGSTHESESMEKIKWDHPRLRGEYFTSDSFIMYHLGSPPLARGVLSSSNPSNSIVRITPACAGSTRGTAAGYCGKQDHPRLRGEYYSKSAHLLSCDGSPPLARGVQLLLRTSYAE